MLEEWQVDLMREQAVERFNATATLRRDQTTGSDEWGVSGEAPDAQQGASFRCRFVASSSDRRIAAAGLAALNKFKLVVAWDVEVKQGDFLAVTPDDITRPPFNVKVDGLLPQVVQVTRVLLTTEET